MSWSLPLLQPFRKLIQMCHKLETAMLRWFIIQNAQFLLLMQMLLYEEQESLAKLNNSINKNHVQQLQQLLQSHPELCLHINIHIVCIFFEVCGRCGVLTAVIFKGHVFAIFLVFIDCKCRSVIMKEYTVGFCKTVLMRSFDLVEQYAGSVYVYCSSVEECKGLLLKDQTSILHWTSDPC